MTQLNLFVSDLNTQSPVNAESIHAQNERLLNHLKIGFTINFIQARKMGIGFLNSRISDLKKNDYVIYDRWISIKGIRCKEYSLTPFQKL